MLEFFKLIEACNPNQQNLVLTIINPDLPGEKALLSNHKLIWESEPGGFFSRHFHNFQDLNTGGLITVGSRQVFCEALCGEKRLVICGGGHVSIPVIQMGKMIGCAVTVLEDRPKFADNARKAGADQVICESFEQGLSKIQGNRDTFFIIVTRGHRYDQLCLQLIAEKEHAYIGMIGSRVRTAKVKEALAEKGVDRRLLEQVHTPIGLKINAETPEEIAVSIMAEIIQVKNQTKRSAGYPAEILRAILDDPAPETGKVLATIVTRKGSAPRDVGTKMLIYRDGRTVGTIGGGCLESSIFSKGIQLLESEDKSPRLYHADITGKDAEDDGMVCGGIVDVLLEVI